MAPKHIARGAGPLMITPTRVALVLSIAALISMLTPDVAHAHALAGEEAMTFILAGAAGLVTVGAGVATDINLLNGGGVSAGLALTFSIANLALGAGLLGYGIRQKKLQWVVIGAIPLVIGLIGTLAAPRRALQRRGEEEPGGTTMPLNTGFGWSFQVGS